MAGRKQRSGDGDTKASETPTPALSAAMEGSVIDRRTGIDRREVARRNRAENGADGEGEGGVTGLERRRGRGRRRGDFREAAEEGEMTQEQFLFLMAVNAFKQANKKTFPTWSDVLEVVRLLGYRKTMASELTLHNAEDWRESADAPAGVRPDGWERRFTSDEKRALAIDDGLPGRGGVDDDDDVPDIEDLRELEREMDEAA